MSVDQPEAPEAPDYAEANKEGIYTDIETLPIRRQVDQAARLGKSVSYWDPATSQYRTADFTGMGDLEYAKQAADLAGQTNAAVQRQQLALREELGVKNAEQTAKEIEASDPLAYKARQDLTQRVLGDLNAPADVVGTNNRLGEIAGQLGGLSGPGADPRLAQLYNEGRQTLSMPKDRGSEIDRATQLQSRGIDPSLGAYAGAVGRYVGDDAGLSRLQNEADRLTQVQALRADPRLASVYRSAASQNGNRLAALAAEADQRLTGDVNDPSTAALNKGLDQAVKEYELGGKLDDASRSEIEQQVRESQAARGNILGNAASFTEAMEVGKAAEARKAQRLQTLLDVQGKAFNQNSSLRDEERNAITQRLGTLKDLDTSSFDREMTKDQLLSELSNQQFGQQQAVSADRQSQVGQRLSTLGGLQQQQQSQSNSRLSALGDLQSRYSANSQYNDAARREDVNQRFSLLGQNDAAQLSAGQSRLQSLLGLAQADNTQQQQGYNNRLGQLMNQSQLFQAQNAEDRATRSENYGRQQQRLANASSFILGQPITNQFGSLQGAQQGSVGYNPIAYQGGQTLNANAGQNAAGFAQQSYGTQANIYSTQAQMAMQDAQSMNSMIGSGVGALSMMAM